MTGETDTESKNPQEQPLSNVEQTPLKELQAAAKNTKVLEGVDARQQDGEAHFAIEVEITASGKASSLMIPDVAEVSQNGPVYITKPIELKGENLAAFFNSKGIKLPTEIAGLLSNTSAYCDAFYVTKTGPLLMKFRLKFDEGIIGNLVDPDLGALFDVTGASLRVVRCNKEQFETLKAYVTLLAA